MAVNEWISVGGKFLLDTNIIIALFAEDQKIMERLKQIPEIFVPSIVLGELYYGAKKSDQVDKNIKQVDEFTSTNIILQVNANTAISYGEIKSILYKKGRPIPENDIWIANKKRH